MAYFFRTNIREYPGRLSGLFLTGYGTARLVAECFRLPDANIGYLFGTEFVTLGMVYTVPMMLFGMYLLLRRGV